MKYRLLIASLFLLVSVAAVAQLPPITKLEAIRLAQHQVRHFRVDDIVLDNNTYTLRGSNEGPSCVMTIDAIKSRVLTVEMDGEDIYTFPGIQLVGHRATVKFAPENTLSAIQAAIDQGMHLLEIDVRETSDGHLVLMHDHTVDKTTDATGPISKMTLKEVRKLEAGAWFDPKFKGEPIPTLEEALDLMEGKAYPDIDFKAGNPKRLVDVLKKYNLTEVTVYCGNWAVIKELKSLCETLNFRPTVSMGREGLPKLFQELNPPIVNINWRQFTEQLVRDVHLSGKKAFLNLMGPMENNALATQLAIDAGADFIQSDEIDLAYSMVKDAGLLAPPIRNED